MPQLSSTQLNALIILAGVAALWVVLSYPIASFGIVFATWSMMRWPHPDGIDQFKVGSARTAGDALYEGLWAALILVGGLSFGAGFLLETVSR